MQRTLLVFLLLATCACAKDPAPDTAPSVSPWRPFLKGYMGDWRPETDQYKGSPVPPARKPVPDGATRIALPAADTLSLGQMPLKTAIGQRRSRRDYADTPLTLDELSFLLWATQGVHKVDRDAEGRIINQYRSVPSGGARHPFETYLLIHRITDVPPGIYRYLPYEHALLRVQSDPDIAAHSQAACYDNQSVAQAAVVFVWAAIPYRTEWRYGPIAHRLIAIEAGHIGQNLYLAAESIESGVCAMLGYNQVRMDALIGVDGEEEFTVYLATVGKQATHAAE